MLKQILQVIRSSERQGQVLVLEGYAGSGKSTILKQLERILKHKLKITSIFVRIAEYDTDYEHCLYFMLRNQITGKLSKWFKRFLSSLSVGYIVEIQGKSLAQEEPMSRRSILEGFIEDLKKFGEKSDEKLLIAFDDYHKASGKILEDMIEEIARNLPRNVVLLIASRHSLRREFSAEKGIKCSTVHVPFFTIEQTTSILEKNVNLRKEEIETFAKMLQETLKGHPRSVVMTVLLAKRMKAPLKELLESVPTKGWEEATHYVSREVIDALQEDERTLIESCYFLPYLDNEICSYFAGVRNAFPTLSRLEGKLILVRKDSTYEVEDLTKEYLDRIIANKKPLYARAWEFFLEKAEESKKGERLSESSRYVFYASDFLIKSENLHELSKFMCDFAEVLLQSGFFRESKKYLQMGRETCADQQMKATLSTNLGDAHRMTGDYAEALKYYEEARDIADIIGDMHGKVWSIRGIAETYRMMGTYDAALQEYQKALTELGDTPNLKAKALILWGIARSHRSMSRYDEALKYYGESQRLAILDEDKYLRELSTWGIAETHRALDNYAEALKYYEEARDIADIIGDMHGKAWSIRGIAECQRAIGLYSEAFDKLKKSADFFEQTGDRHGMAWNTWSIAETYRLNDEHDMALQYYEKARQEAEKAQAVRCLGWTYRGVAEVYRMIGKEDEAKTKYEEAMTIARKIKDKKGELRTFLGLAEILRIEGLYGDGVALCKEARKIAIDIKVKVETANLALCEAELCRIQDRIDITLYDESWRIYDSAGVNLGLVHTLIGRGLAYFQLSRSEDAKQDLDDAKSLSEKYCFKSEIAFTNRTKEREGDEFHVLKFL